MSEKFAKEINGIKIDPIITNAAPIAEALLSMPYVPRPVATISKKE